MASSRFRILEYPSLADAEDAIRRLERVDLHGARVECVLDVSPLSRLASSPRALSDLCSGRPRVVVAVAVADTTVVLLLLPWTATEGVAAAMTITVVDRLLLVATMIVAVAVAIVTPAVATDTTSETDVAMITGTGKGIVDTTIALVAMRGRIAMIARRRCRVVEEEEDTMTVVHRLPVVNVSRRGRTMIVVENTRDDV